MPERSSVLPQSLYSRKATHADVDALVAFINHVYAKDNREYKGMGRTNSVEITRHIEAGHFLLIETDGQLDGIIYVELRDGERGYLGLLAVHPERQRQGIATRLGKAAEEFCREQGCRIVEGRVLSSKLDLIAAYLQNGYRIAGNIPYDLLVEPSSLHILEKDLLPLEGVNSPIEP